MVEYDPAALQRLQKVQLGILKDLDAVCKKYQLPYFANGGTLLGAVRHQGFIPWDDDIDVCMLRKDYDRFIECCVPELQDRYDWLTMDTTKGYVLEFGKLSKKGTTFVEATDQNRRYHSGIFLDIFPCDNAPDDEAALDRKIRKTWFWLRMAVLSQYAKPKLPPDLSKGLTILSRIGCALLHVGAKLFGFTQKRCHRNFLKHATQYNHTQTERTILYELLRTRKQIQTMEEIFPLVDLPFEDTVIPCPRQADAVLTRLFGDYMQLPAEDQRKNHAAAVLDFGEGTD